LHRCAAIVALGRFCRLGRRRLKFAGEINKKDRFKMRKILIGNILTLLIFSFFCDLRLR
jgi:hypothetical protein